MAVCSLDEAVRLTSLDKHYWNVVSICGPREQKASLRLAKTIHYACFDDVEDVSSAIHRRARDIDIADIFGFLRSLGPGPPLPPVMIHCQQGISRSAAVALSWIYGQLPPTNERLANAVDSILLLRAHAKPNRLVLTSGLAEFLPLTEARQIAETMLADPRFVRNRFQVPQSES